MSEPDVFSGEPHHLSRVASAQAAVYRVDYASMFRAWYIHTVWIALWREIVGVIGEDDGFIKGPPNRIDEDGIGEDCLIR